MTNPNTGTVIILWDRRSDRRDDDPGKLVLTVAEARRMMTPSGGAMDALAGLGYHAIYEQPGAGFEVRVDGVMVQRGRTMGELRAALKGLE